MLLLGEYKPEEPEERLGWTQTVKSLIAGKSAKGNLAGGEGGRGVYTNAGQHLKIAQLQRKDNFFLGMGHGL